MVSNNFQKCIPVMFLPVILTPWLHGGSCADLHIVGTGVLNRLVQFNVIRRYVKTNSIYTTHRLNALAAPPGIRV